MARESRQIRIEPRFESWQTAARELLRDEVPPDSVEWQEGGTGHAQGLDPIPPPSPGTHRVPRRFLELARRAAGQPSPATWARLYRVLWRIVRENHDLLQFPHDPDVAALLRVEEGSVDELTLQPSAPEVASAAPFVPADATIPALREAARACTGCELHRFASQTVFSQGPATARVALVGEQPGDQEDLQGLPFVGPAGQVLDRALGEVGLRREELYLTNVVKHFKFVRTGKRRLHATPQEREILACRPWLEAELQAVRPEVLVCLGATAARSIFGPSFRLMKQRGNFIPTRWTPRTLATFHPSAVLRAEDAAGQERLYGLLKEDLAKAAAR